MKEYKEFVQSISEKEYQESKQRAENYAALLEEIEKEYKMETFHGNPEFSKDKYSRKMELFKKDLGAIHIENTAP